MANPEYRITRSRDTWKPRVCEEDIPFFQNENSAEVFVGIGNGECVSYSGSGRSLIAELPYASTRNTHVGEGVKELPFLSLDELPQGIELSYRIDGGFNNNCLVVFWNTKPNTPYEIEWVCLKTFTGMQLKYPLPKKRPQLIFAFAQEDAFSYCDKTPCEECMFKCKSGFAAYVSVRNLGIVKMPIDRVSMAKPSKN